MARFSEKKGTDHKMCSLIFFYFCLKHFSFQEDLGEIWSEMYTGLHVKQPLFLPILIKLKLSRQTFEKYSNIEFHENPSRGSRDVPCGRTDMTKVTVAYRSFANASEIRNR